MLNVYKVRRKKVTSIVLNIAFTYSFINCLESQAIKFRKEKFYSTDNVPFNSFSVENNIHRATNKCHANQVLVGSLFFAFVFHANQWVTPMLCLFEIEQNGKKRFFARLLVMSAVYYLTYSPWHWCHYSVLAMW